MTDTNNVTQAEQKAYSIWQSMGMWVASHPKTAIAIAGGVILALIIVLH